MLQVQAAAGPPRADCLSSVHALALSSALQVFSTSTLRPLFARKDTDNFHSVYRKALAESFSPDSLRWLCSTAAARLHAATLQAEQCVLQGFLSLVSEQCAEAVRRRPEDRHWPQH